MRRSTCSSGISKLIKLQFAILNLVHSICSSGVEDDEAFEVEEERCDSEIGVDSEEETALGVDSGAETALGVDSGAETALGVASGTETALGVDSGAGTALRVDSGAGILSSDKDSSDEEIYFLEKEEDSRLFEVEEMEEEERPF
jgi:hypothetical protein